MIIKLSENIRAFRKERKMTQEQLAEALGVTVGAVSKWESGSSIPDISLIMEMADFFETSVDVLLGFDRQSGSLENARKIIKSLRNEKKFDEASVEAEKALKKYPNSFDLVFQCAIMYTTKGVEQSCKKSYQRALTLFEQSLELIDQNTDEKINEWLIRNRIADVYLCLGRTKEALDLMRKNNADGLNNGDIGYTLVIAEKNPTEGLNYLSDALIEYMIRVYRTMIGYTNAYIQRKEYKKALEALEWVYGMIYGLRLPGHTSYYLREEVQILIGCAKMTAMLGDEKRTREYLGKAIECANEFDTNPDYTFIASKFYNSTQTSVAFDDFGITALEGIKLSLKETDGEPITEIYKKVLNELC